MGQRTWSASAEPREETNREAWRLGGLDSGSDFHQLAFQAEAFVSESQNLPTDLDHRQGPPLSKGEADDN